MQKNHEKPNWKLEDLLVIFCFYFLAGLFSSVLQDQLNISRNLRSIIFYLLIIFTFYWWVNLNYKFKLEYFGLNIEKLSYKFIFIGILVAVIYKILSILILLLPHYSDILINFDFSNIFSFRFLFLSVFLPFTFWGIRYLILGPIIEEVLFRGILFIVLRDRFGLIIALIIQALLFSAIHIYTFNDLTSFINSFLIGITLGILYQKTNSLYTAIICHSVLNYSVFVFSKISYVN